MKLSFSLCFVLSLVISLLHAAMFVAAQAMCNSASTGDFCYSANLAATDPVTPVTGGFEVCYDVSVREPDCPAITMITFPATCMPGQIQFLSPPAFEIIDGTTINLQATQTARGIKITGGGIDIVSPPSISNPQQQSTARICYRIAGTPGQFDLPSNIGPVSNAILTAANGELCTIVSVPALGCTATQCPATSPVNCISFSPIMPNPTTTATGSSATQICFNVIVNPACSQISAFAITEFSLPIDSSTCNAANFVVLGALVDFQNLPPGNVQRIGNYLLVTNGGNAFSSQTPLRVCVTLAGMARVTPTPQSEGLDFITNVCGLQATSAVPRILCPLLNTCPLECGANAVLNETACTCGCSAGFAPIPGSNPFACAPLPFCPPSAVCGSNAVLNSLCQCQCLPGFTPIPNVVPFACQPIVTPPFCPVVCGPNAVLNASCQCQCIAGFVPVANTVPFACTPQAVPPVCTSCFNGTCLPNNVCQCPSGFVLDNSFCIPVLPVPPACTACFNGTCLANNVCQCPSGFTLQTGFCVPVASNPVPPVCTSCFNGTCLANNVCQCPSGFQLLNGFCIPPGGIVPPPASGGGGGGGAGISAGMATTASQSTIYVLIATMVALLFSNIAAIILGVN